MNLHTCNRLAARLIGLLVLLTSLCACHDDDTNPSLWPKDKVARRTVLIYMCAQNSLGANHYHRSDSIEIMQGRKFIAPNDRLLLYVDDANYPRLMEIRASSDRPVLLRQWNQEVNSADPQTLCDVASWVRQHCPAEEYGLVLWSHADGWIPATNKEYSRSASTFAPFSFGIDVGTGGSMSGDRDLTGTPGPQMDITDMAQALEESGMHLRYILFDACLMQNVESDYALRHATDYVVASPMAISAYGGNYTHLIQAGLFSPQVEDIVTTYYADIIDPAQNRVYGDYGIVISCVRTAALDSLAHTIAQLLPNSSIAIDDTMPNFNDVQHYHPYHSHYYYRPKQHDLRSTMQRILSEKDMQRLDEVLAQAITCKRATTRFWAGPSNWSYINVDTTNYCGVAAFLPQPAYTQNAKACIFGDLNEQFRQTEWYRAAGWTDYDERLLRLPL